MEAVAADVRPVGDGRSDRRSGERDGDGDGPGNEGVVVDRDPNADGGAAVDRETAEDGVDDDDDEDGDADDGAVGDPAVAGIVTSAATTCGTVVAGWEPARTASPFAPSRPSQIRRAAGAAALPPVPACSIMATTTNAGLAPGPQLANQEVSFLP